MVFRGKPVPPEPERRDFRCLPLCRSQSWVLVPMPEVSAMLLGIVQDEQATALARI